MTRLKDVCPSCLGNKSIDAEMCRHCRRRSGLCQRWGEENSAWRGNAVKNPGLAGRKRAIRRFSLGLCVDCGKPGVDRHHEDGDTLNNDEKNVTILCRSCHMRRDGRADILLNFSKSRIPNPPKNCDTCDRLYKPLRRGLCSRCYDRTYRPNRRYRTAV